LEMFMGIKERKVREKENLRKLIVATAHEILMKEGLGGLTMRSIANHIEYSQSKIYEFFASKDQLCETLCEELCEKHLVLLRSIPEKMNPEEYLTDLIMKTIEFHGSHPHSDTLFTLVCFGPERFKIPEAFLDIEKLFLIALRNLKSPYISEENLLVSLDIIRCIFIGVSTLMNTETSVQGRSRALNMTKNALGVLLRGWRK
jgi:AcrR family transcriptional regulator